MFYLSILEGKLTSVQIYLCRNANRNEKSFKTSSKNNCAGAIKRAIDLNVMASKNYLWISSSHLNYIQLKLKQFSFK